MSFSLPWFGRAASVLSPSVCLEYLGQQSQSRSNWLQMSFRVAPCNGRGHESQQTNQHWRNCPRKSECFTPGHTSCVVNVIFRVTILLLRMFHVWSDIACLVLTARAPKGQPSPKRKTDFGIHFYNPATWSPKMIAANKHQDSACRQNIKIIVWMWCKSVYNLDCWRPECEFVVLLYINQH